VAADGSTHRREILRDNLLRDIHRIALEQITSGGIDALSMSGIAKRLGMSAPSLYHYFTSRDDLLASVVLESHEALTAAQVAATERAKEMTAADRFRLVVNVARQWSLENKQRYRLLFVTAPGALQSRADDISPVARRGLEQVIAAVAAFEPSDPFPDLSDEILAAQVADAWTKSDSLLKDSAPAVILRGFQIHCRLLGIINLEVAGVFDGSGIDMENLWKNEVERIIAELSSGTAKVLK
jgi:AcrR family transcriptional regulator